MSNSSKADDENREEADPRRNPFAFWLIIWLLVVLVALIVFALTTPADYLTGVYSGDDDDRINSIIEFKKHVLSAIIASFSVWIGAGAAYFFGRENYQLAMKQMKKMGPQFRSVKKTELNPSMSQQKQPIDE